MRCRGSRLLLLVALVAVPARGFSQESTAETEADVAVSDVSTPGLPLVPIASIWSRFEVRRNYETAEVVDADFVRYRTRIGLASSAVPVSDRLDLFFRIVPQASGLWHVGGDTLDDAALNLHEGTLSVYGRRLHGEAGRFEMVYGDALVIGNVDWNQTGRSFDGLRLHLEPRADGYWIDAFATVLEEGVASGDVGDDFASGDLYFVGLYAGLGSLITPAFALDVYALSRIAPSTDVLGLETAADLTLGVRVRNRSGLLDYRLEAGVQLGTRHPVLPATENRDVIAYQGDVEIGLNFFEGDRFRVGLEGLYASGDDPTTDELEAWDQLYPTAHKWLGYTDVIGPRTNIAGGVLHLTAWPTVHWSAYVDGHVFARPEVADDLSSYVGSEVDIGSTYRFGAGLKLRTGYAVYVPGEDHGDDPTHLFELELRYDY